VSDPLVTVIFPHQGRTGTVHMRWIKGKSVQRYFHEYPLKFYGLVGKRRTHKMYNRKGAAVSLSYQPEEGDAVVLVRVREGRD